MDLLDKTIKEIEPISKDILLKAQKRQDSLTKPRGAFGRLEDLSIKIAGIQNRVDPVIKDKAVLLFAGDHLTVHEEGIASAPIEVTSQMLTNFVTCSGAGVNVLAEHVGARVVVTDVGVATGYLDSNKIIKKNIQKGAKNMTLGPAMSRDDALKAIETGIEVFNLEKSRGLDILAVGEMGIGNTTPSSAIYSIITGISVEEVTGPGAGIIDEKLEKKINTIKSAIMINDVNKGDAIDILSKVGGFEIGAMAGAMIGAAASRTAVMVDGFIATASALLAITIAPGCQEYLITAHHSAETGHGNVLEFLKERPLLDLDMRLGEGTGALLGISLAEASVKILNNMTTFSEAEVIKAKERDTL